MLNILLGRRSTSPIKGTAEVANNTRRILPKPHVQSLPGSVHSMLPSQTFKQDYATGIQQVASSPQGVNKQALPPLSHPAATVPVALAGVARISDEAYCRRRSVSLLPMQQYQWGT